MAAGRNATARSQWVAQAMEEERRALERRRRILGSLYDEVDRYLSSARRVRDMLKEISSEFGLTRADVKRMFDMSDREVAALYEPRTAAVKTDKTDVEPTDTDDAPVVEDPAPMEIEVSPPLQENSYESVTVSGEASNWDGTNTSSDQPYFGIQPLGTMYGDGAVRV